MSGELFYSNGRGGCLTDCIRGLQGDGTELCSQFSRYISPAYHHDKCERCVQMRLYSMSKTDITCVYFLFVTVLGIAMIIGTSGPPIENTRITSFTPDGKEIRESKPFIFDSPTFTRYEKQVWLFTVLQTDNVDDETYAENIRISVALTGLRSTKSNRNGTNARAKNEHTDDISTYFGNVSFRNRSRRIRCKGRICDPILVAHLSFIEFTRYRIAVKLYNLQSFERKYAVKNVSFMFRSYKEEYTKMVLSFRTVYVISSVCAVLWFGNSLRKYAIHDWTYEQKWLLLITILLVLYNGPTFSVTFLIDHWMFAFLEAAFQISFFAAWSLFNMCIYHAFRQVLKQNERRFVSFYLEKLFVVFVMWIIWICIAYHQTVNESYDYSFNSILDWNSYEVAIKWWWIFVIFYLTYSLISILRAYTDLRTMSYFDRRLKFAIVNAALMALLWYLSKAYDYGLIGIVEDTNVAYATEATSHSTSIMFMIVYTCLNFNLYLMLYAYSPSQKSITENIVLKDNPTISMVNDSEDDDITVHAATVTKAGEEATKLLLNTSDDEDMTRASLLRSNGINIKGHNDDSD